MNSYRIFVEKKPSFEVESQSLLKDLRGNLQINSLSSVRVINIYDLFNLSEEVLEKASKSVFSEPPTDLVFNSIDLTGKNFFAVEFLPGQFDQRADSAMQCLGLISDSTDAVVKSGKLIILEGNVSADEMAKIKKYYIK